MRSVSPAGIRVTAPIAMEWVRAAMIIASMDEKNANSAMAQEIVSIATAWVIPAWATRTALTVPTASAEAAAAKVNGIAPPATVRVNATIVITDSAPPAAVDPGGVDGVFRRK